MKIDIFVLMAEDMVIKVTTNKEEAEEWADGKLYWFAKEPLTVPEEIKAQKDY